MRLPGQSGKLKVKILKTVTGFFYNGKSYAPGETVIIDARRFNSHFMQVVEVIQEEKPT